MSNNKPLVIYHAGCPDGFCSAFIAWKFFRGEADFYPASYGTPPPLNDIEGRDIYILDFSYPKDTYIKILSTSKTSVLLDHHKTAQADLEPFITVDAVIHHTEFDMNRSGAGMAWDYFYGPDRHLSFFQRNVNGRPWFVSYVQDRDLWKFELRSSKEVNAFLSTLPLNFEVWDKEFENTTIEGAIDYGKVILRKIDKYNEEMMKRHMFYSILWPDHPLDENQRPIRVPVVNAPYLGISELLNHIIVTTKSQVAIGFSYNSKGFWQYSLRGDGSIDVSEIAKKFGGGGHKNAAGFELTTLIFSIPTAVASDKSD